MTTPYVKRKVVLGELVVVMDLKRSDRNLQLIDVPSRVVRKGEIHELILTDELPQVRTVNRVAYVGFVEILSGGLLVPGDQVFVDTKMLGRLLGFDETHMPNHYNIVIQTKHLLTGKELDLFVGQTIHFIPEEK